jgi:prevent-host-death family protein
MVLEVGAFEAKTRLAQLLERVRQGDRVVITHRGTPVAVLVPPEEVARGQVAEAIRKLDELRARSKKGPESIPSLRRTGRRH